MGNIMSGGSKLHLIDYKGVELESGMATLKISSKAYKSCGGRYKGAVNAIEFSKYAKETPEFVCKKCLKRLNVLIGQAKTLRKTSA